MKPIILLLTFTASLTAASLPPIFLWPNGAPGSEGKDTPEILKESANSELTISNVHKPSITAFLPRHGAVDGAAVIIAPGGGHKILSMTHEGTNVAVWLSEHGIAAFVLKYRLANEEGSTYTVDDHAVADMHRAIRLVRSRAAEWKINSSAVGVMGFSAGGEVCAMASQKFDAANPLATDPLEKFSDRPDFQALIYPGRSFRIVPAKDTSPAFLAASSNDRPDISEGLAHVYLDFKKVSVPVELHLYADGAHGFGHRPGKNGPVAGWIGRFNEWLVDRNFTKS